MSSLDDTNHPELRSWVETANESSTDFPIQNLPFGVFARTGRGEAPRVGVAIGDQIVDVVACADEGLIAEEVRHVVDCCRESSLNSLMALGRDRATALRRALSDILRVDSASGERARAVSQRILVPIREAELSLPARIGDYTDFYASIDHATNV